MRLTSHSILIAGLRDGVRLIMIRMYADPDPPSIHPSSRSWIGEKLGRPSRRPMAPL